MATQSREIYQTGNPSLDIVLARIGARLDVIEGLRPDLDSGLLSLTESKTIGTADTASFQTVVTGVAISSSGVVITNTTLEVLDENGELIHKFE